MSVAIIAILAGMLLPALARPREAARQVKCLHQLRITDQALSRYMNDKGKFPGELQDLVDGGYLTSDDTLVCPSSGYADHYDYYPGAEAGDPGAVLVKDSSANHMDGGNALFGDGSVKKLSEYDWEILIDNLENLDR